MRWSDFQAQVLHLPETDRERVKAAFEMGQTLHAGQKRASGEDYFTHCIAVALLLSHYNADADTLCAALLHDSIEDTSITLKDVERQFGRKTTLLIDGVTKLTREELTPSPTLDEKIETLRKMFTLLRDDVRIMVIKLCDRLHNMQTIAYLPVEKQLRLAQETWDVYAKIADRLCMQDLRHELNRLCVSILQREEYPTLLQERDALLRRAERISAAMQEAWTKERTSLPSNLTIHPETMCWVRISGGIPFPLPISFVVTGEEDCYRMLYCIHTTFRRVLGSFEDFINSPQINGYRAVHTTVALGDGTRVRCKIRTEEMHAYARQGVTMWCFDEKERSKRAGKLAWALQLPTLAAETSDRSEEFFEGLRSDILGETITVHGPEDRPITVPAGATVLDGAFYCFGRAALRLQSLSLNGQDVTFQTPLEPGASLEATFGKEKQASREWLTFVTTRHAASFIYRELSELPPQTKMEIGKELLQEVFAREKRGLIEEFDTAALEERLKLSGVPSLDHAYVALAEGRRTPEEITDVIFATPKRGEEKFTPCVIRFRSGLDRQAIIRQLFERYEGNHLDLTDIRSWKFPGSLVRHWRVTCTTDPTDRRALLKDIHLTGVTDVSVGTPSTHIKYWTGIAILFFLWGMDPVIARLLIQTFGLSAVNLTVVRFWSLAALSGLLLLWTRFHHRLPEARLPLKSKSLWLSVVLLFFIALTTYASLQTTHPSHYTIPMTAGGLMLTSIVNRHRWRILLVTWGLMILGTLLLVLKTPDWPLSGVILTLLTVSLFSAFCVVSERYKSKEKVAARAAQYFFVLSLSCALLTLPFLPFLSPLTSPTILSMILFSIVFVGLPYYMYYYLLSYRQIDFVLRFSFLIIPVSVGGQVIVLGHLTPTIVLASILVTAGALLPILLPTKRTE